MITIDPPPMLVLIAAVALGLVVGSFLNVVIRRLPKILKYRWLQESAETLAETGKEVLMDDSLIPPSLSLPPSHCPTCKQYLKPLHKIPVLSYILLRGRCGFCRSPIGKQYPVVELLALGAAVVVAAHFGASFQGLAALAFSWILIALAFIDYNEQLLPDELTLGLMWIGLTANAFGLFTDAASAVFGAGSGYALLWLIYQGMRLVTGRHGLGYGDMKLLAAIGAWFGWEILPFILLAASLLALAVSAAMLVARKMKKEELMPFGPYLSAAAWLFFVYLFILEHEWKFASNH